MEIKFKKLYKNVETPTKGSEYSAGFDLRAISVENTSCNPLIIAPHETVKIHTGLSFEIPNEYFGAIFARSGIATKEGLRPANCVGVVDSDYRGEVIVALYNDSDDCRFVKENERIAQIVFIPYLNTELVETTDNLSDTERGTGGFGSTGSN